jgi:hypothetical protein
MKTYIANILASLVFLVIGVFAIWYSPFELWIQLSLGVLLVVIIMIFWFLWQPQESGNESMKLWCWMTVLGLVLSPVGLWIGALIYHVSFLELLKFDPAAWDGLGYMGPLIIGPFMVVLGIVSMIRKVILDAMNK